MCAEIFRGKPVLHCSCGVDYFYAELFCMLDDAIGDECIIEKDAICRHHFHALVGRLCELCYGDDTSDDISEFLLVTLGNARA